MPNKVFIKSFVLPLNTYVFFGLNQKAKQQSWNLMSYPSFSEFISVDNLESAGFAFSKLLPLFPVFIHKNEIHCFIKFPKRPGNYSAVLGHSFNNFNKTIAEASFGFVKLLQFVGFRFRQKWLRSACSVRLRLGYNTKVWVKGPNDFVTFIKKHNPKRRTNYFFSFDKEYLKLVTDSIYKYRTRSNYKGRGINMREQPMEMKEGKKTLW